MMSELRQMWRAWGEIGTRPPWNFPEGAIREAMIVATLVCWMLALVLALT